MAFTRARLVVPLILLAIVGCGGSEQKGAPVTKAPAPKTDLTSNLRTETGVSDADRAANQRHASAARKPAVPMPSCVRDYSGQVYSSRNGVRPTEFHLHYTVSANRAGWGDVRAIQDYFKRTRVGSSTFIVDFEGHCLKMVPESQKPWTAGNANPWAVSVEIVATGSETKAQWRSSPLFQKKVLARLVRNVMDRWGMHVKWVDPIGCVFPSGWSDHNALECGNNHTDVGDTFPFGLLGKQLHSYD